MIQVERTFRRGKKAENYCTITGDVFEMQEQLDAFTLVEEPNCPKCGWNAVLKMCFVENFHVPLAIELKKKSDRPLVYLKHFCCIC